jgi:hypothetical protein
MESVIPQNFLQLSANMKNMTEVEIRAKYPDLIASKLINSSIAIGKMVEENNDHFAIRVDHYCYFTKDPNKADVTVRVDSKSDSSARIITKIQNPNDTHKYNAKACIKDINKKLKAQGIEFIFNMSHFTLFCNYYDMKANQKWCFVTKINKDPTYSYSMFAIDFIVCEIVKDPDNIVDTIKILLKEKREQKKVNPGGKGF